MPELLHSMGLAATASCMAVTVSNPMEVVKIRLQLQGELKARSQYTAHYRGIGHALTTIARNEGIFALQKGIGSAYCHQIVMNGLRLGSYDSIKSLVGGVLGPQYSYATNISSGALCGMVGGFVSSPLFLVKTRLQARSTAIAVGQQHNYTNLFDGLRTILREDGIRGAYKGSTTAAQRTGVGSAAQLSAYDACKDFGVRSGFDDSDVRLHLASSCVSAVCITAVMNPFDVVMTRRFNGTADKAYSANLIKSFYLIAKTEGIYGLYKGSLALTVRTGPHTILTFIFLEQLKQLYARWAAA